MSRDTQHSLICGVLFGFLAGFGLCLLLSGILCAFLCGRLSHHETIDSAEEASDLYPKVPVATIAAGKWDRPRATITGTVAESHDEADGDRHFRVTDGKDFVVCEIVPELPLPHPKNGDKVTVKGIVREDKHHGWWELHPVTAWSKK